MDQKTEDELGEKLYKRLWGRRYLIIFDDIWSVEAWDSIKVYLPENQNRSRVVVTTRQSDVANHLGSSCLVMNFLDDEKMKLHDIPEPISKERRLVIHGNIPEEKHYPTESAPFIRSLYCKGGNLSFDYRLLKVVKEVEGVASEVDGSFLEIKLQQVNLRYLDCNFIRLLLAWELPGRPILSLCFPSSISLLWNLQTIIIKSHPGHILAPSEIWKMAQLRHVQVIGIHLPDPPLSDEENDFVALQNLQTLFEVRNFRLSEDVCRRILNIKKLHVGYCDPSSYYDPHNLCHLKKLESLRCFFPKEANWRSFVLSFTFPSSLKELHLRSCFLHWEDLTMIGSLPHLEVLKLDCKSVVGSEWNSVEGEFERLKVLKIYACEDLIHWNAESCHFPVLEKLVLERMNVLDEIPSGIGEIPTLGFIRLECCSVSAAISAMRMLVEQECLGNEGLQLEVEFWNEEELECFREMVRAEGLSSNNLRLQKDGLG
ncbi:hypothetical protein ACS0TY_007058 [Phlomoides rotata]